ncbi:hypothetical protein MJO28_004238 [Puccinia striiformis f. sp. tritici]|uniref:Uncharacterized protein n=1 Tax=Puccinia striiformis f. sp. tritici TaxID=168172 RepID=A0ACC0EQH0_9BASI|nr:hypothetical protein MJO28_004238 [Puccinia striiformis f. sp. tritici]
MVIDARIPETESEFWDGREESLYHDARLDAQKIERSAQMVDPRPETTDNDEIRMSITPQMLRDFFRPISDGQREQERYLEGPQVIIIYHNI